MDAKEVVAKYGIHVLLILLEKGGKARHKDLEGAFSYSSSVLNKTLKVLESEKLVKRKVNEKARPPVPYYVVTREGLNFVETHLLKVLKVYAKVRPNRTKELLENFLKGHEETIKNFKRRRR